MSTKTTAEMHGIGTARDAWVKNGVVLLEPGATLFSDDDIAALHQLSSQLSYEWVEVGDVGEPNAVEVGRFMTDIERPEMVNRPLSDRAIDIICKPDYMALFQDFLNADELHIRRMQVNMIHRDGFVGHHLDIDSNPDYKAAVILQFGNGFEGGEFVVYGENETIQSIKPTHYSMIISDCRYPHEVKPVRSGVRISLVFFLSENDGANSRLQTI
jgi:hypothetical protein